MKLRKSQNKTLRKKNFLILAISSIILLSGLVYSTKVFGEFSNNDDVNLIETNAENNLNDYDSEEDSINESETKEEEITYDDENSLNENTSDKSETDLIKNRSIQEEVENETANDNLVIRYYAQDDYSYANVMYSSCNNAGQTIESSGCGPTAYCIVASSLNNVDINPVDMCNYSVSNGFRLHTGGTSSNLFTAAATDKNNPNYNLNYCYFTQVSSVKNILSDGKHLVIASMAPSHVTRYSHYIVLSGIREVNGKVYFEVYDPHSRNEYYIYDDEIIDETKEDGFILLSEKAVINEGKYFYAFSNINN